MRTKKHDDIDFQGLSEIINDLGVDGRTKAAIKINRLKMGLRHGGNKALIEIFVNVIALNLLLEQRLTQELLKDSSLLDDDGSLKPVVSKDLLKLRSDTLNYLKMLQSVQSNGKGEKSNNSLADMLNEDN